MVQPIRDLLKIENKFEWLPIHNSEFVRLKRAIASAPCIRNFDSTKDTFLTTDASNRGIGATLSQVQEGKEKNHSLCFPNTHRC